MDRPDARLPKWLPNAITVARITLIPFFIAAASAADPAGETWSSRYLTTLAILLALAGSDVLDGWLARRFGLATPLGAFLDAFADKLAQIALIAFFTFTTNEVFARVPIWFFALIVGRDLVLAIGSLLVRARRGKVSVEHESHGRVASFLMFSLLIWITAGGSDQVVTIAAWVIAAVVTPSTLSYMHNGWRQAMATE